MMMIMIMYQCLPEQNKRQHRRTIDLGHLCPGPKTVAVPHTSPIPQTPSHGPNDGEAGRHRPYYYYEPHVPIPTPHAPTATPSVVDLSPISPRPSQWSIPKSHVCYDCCYDKHSVLNGVVGVPTARSKTKRPCGAGLISRDNVSSITMAGGTTSTGGGGLGNNNDDNDDDGTFQSKSGWKSSPSLGGCAWSAIGATLL
eukprot:scaffold51837_cov56-Attheya_sp.AAC.1